MDVRRTVLTVLLGLAFLTVGLDRIFCFESPENPAATTIAAADDCSTLDIPLAADGARTVHGEHPVILPLSFERPAHPAAVVMTSASRVRVPRADPRSCPAPLRI